MTSNDGCDCAPDYHEYGVHAPGHRPGGAKPPVPLGAYPVEDFASMSASSAALLLRRAAIEAESVVEACPHIVMTRDPDTGDTSYGPFPTGLEALNAAQRLVERSRAVDPHRRFTLTVAPVLPN